jgi:hypothetical protein
MPLALLQYCHRVGPLLSTSTYKAGYITLDVNYLLTERGKEEVWHVVHVCTCVFNSVLVYCLPYHYYSMFIWMTLICCERKGTAATDNWWLLANWWLLGTDFEKKYSWITQQLQSLLELSITFFIPSLHAQRGECLKWYRPCAWLVVWYTPEEGEAS